MSESDAPLGVSDAHTAMPSLQGRKAVITGGTTGIGRAIAVLLASEGAEVFICGRDPRHLEDSLRRVNEVGKGHGISVDLSRKEDLHKFFAEAASILGAFDIAVINAAIPAEDATQTAENEIRYQLETDLVSYVVCAHEAANRMGPGSDMILIGSMSAVSQTGGNSIYVAAKAGVQGFAASLRKELAEKDVKVGLIEPGFTGADFQYPEFPPEKQRAQINADKMLRAEDIAVAAHFMLTQPRRTAISLIRVETRLKHE